MGAGCGDLLARESGAQGYSERFGAGDSLMEDNPSTTWFLVSRVCPGDPV